jgi:hypothetical protein
MFNIEDIRSLIPTIIGDTSFYLESKNNLMDVVNHKSTVGLATDTVSFPTIQKYSSSDVYELDIGTDATVYSDPTLGAIDAKITTENVIMAKIPKMTTLTKDDIVETIVNLFVDAELSKVEKDIVEKFSSFTTTIGGAGTIFTPQLIANAKKAIQMKKFGLVGMISENQYYGPKGLFGFTQSDHFEGVLGKEFIMKGFVSNAYNIDWLPSSEISEDIGGLGDAGGAIMTKRAIGLHTKNLADIEMELHAVGRYYIIVCTGRFKTVMVNTNQGIYLLTDVTV